MDDILKIIGKNIEDLMNKKGISMRTLADVIGVKHPTLSNYISGESAIDSAKLFKMAEYFGVEFDDFFLANATECTLLFRADNPAANFSGNQRQMVYNNIRDYIGIVGERQFIAYIPQNYSIKVTGKSISDDEDRVIRKIAIEQRRMLGIEDVIPDNYYKVFADNGINIMAIPMDNKNIFGCSFIDKNFGSLIFVNCAESISEERQLFSLCHEYGHLLFHRDEYLRDPSTANYESKLGDMREKVADRFAGYFLIPEDILRKKLNDEEFASDNRINVIALKKYFKVSYASLVIALHNYNIISTAAYRNAYKDIMAKQYDKIEPAPLSHLSVEEKNTNLIDAMRFKFLSNEISENKIKDLLCIDNITVRKLIRKWNEEIDEQEQFEAIQF